MVAALVIVIVVLLSQTRDAAAIRAVRGEINGGEAPPRFKEAPQFRNGAGCGAPPDRRRAAAACDPTLVHVAMTLDRAYLRGTIAAVHSILKHGSCPESVFFHFVASAAATAELRRVLAATFPSLLFKIYPFNQESDVAALISPSVRGALDRPLNYARNYLASLLDACVNRVVYLDSDVILVDDVRTLWDEAGAGGAVIAAPEYCGANFTAYFTAGFWDDAELGRTFEGRRACYFNTGVMVMDLERWREGGYEGEIRRWMEVQKRGKPRIYELGSLPPLMLVFAGHVYGLDHRWNQHGLGGDNGSGNCRKMHDGAVSLMHWSGKGKPWDRLDAGRPCSIDFVWKAYDLVAF